METKEQARQALVSLRHLRKSQGWAELCKFAAGQIATRRDAFELIPLTSFDGALEQEFKKGEIAGIRTFVLMPDALIESLESELTEEEQEDETE